MAKKTPCAEAMRADGRVAIVVTPEHVYGTRV